MSADTLTAEDQINDDLATQEMLKMYEKTLNPNALEKELDMSSTQEMDLNLADLPLGELIEDIDLSDPVVPEVVKAEAVEPEAVEPEAVEPEAVEPEAVEPEAVEPEAVEPEAVEPEAVEPEAVEPEAVEPEAVEPEAVEPEAVEPEAVEPEAVEPEAVEPEAVEPEAVEPEAVEPEAVEPEAVEPEAVEPEAVEPEAVEPEAVEPEAVEPEAVEPEAVSATTEPAGSVSEHISAVVDNAMQALQDWMEVRHLGGDKSNPAQHLAQLDALLDTVNQQQQQLATQLENAGRMNSSLSDVAKGLGVELPSPASLGWKDSDWKERATTVANKTDSISAMNAKLKQQIAAL